jgi:hypothetical protein
MTAHGWLDPLMGQSSSDAGKGLLFLSSSAGACVEQALEVGMPTRHREAVKRPTC